MHDDDNEERKKKKWIVIDDDGRMVENTNPIHTLHTHLCSL